jgi:hypothetical protein
MNATLSMKTLGRDSSSTQSIRMLIVGNMARWQACGRLPKMPPDCEYVDFAQLDRSKIRQFRPDLVLSALMSEGFDAFDVAEKLDTLKYRGMYRVVASDLPDAKVIRRDIRLAAPNLDFNLLVLPRVLP